jgi:hypothetical protein
MNKKERLSMKEISFYDYGIEDILLGFKASTLRLNEAGFEKGETLRLIRQNGDQVGYLFITNKDRIKYKDLTAGDALTENWNNLKTIKDRLKFSYPEISNDDELYQYSFRYMSNLSTEGKRGRKLINLDNISTDLFIYSSNKEKYKRFNNILKSFFKKDGDIKHCESSNSDEPYLGNSAEERAIVKAKRGYEKLKRPCFSTDDMIMIEDDGSFYQFPNMKDLVVERLDQNITYKVIIKTGLAIVTEGGFKSNIVLRSFFLKPGKNKNRNNLNDCLYLNKDDQLPISSNYKEHGDKIIIPLELGVKELLQGVSP